MTAPSRSRLGFSHTAARFPRAGTLLLLQAIVPPVVRVDGIIEAGPSGLRSIRCHLQCIDLVADALVEKLDVAVAIDRVDAPRLAV